MKIENIAKPSKFFNTADQEFLRSKDRIVNSQSKSQWIHIQVYSFYKIENKAHFMSARHTLRLIKKLHNQHYHITQETEAKIASASTTDCLLLSLSSSPLALTAAPTRHRPLPPPARRSPAG